MTSAPVRDELALIRAARDGDEEAYRALVDHHRGELHAHCYRMLASVHDADDAVQDVMVKAWKGLAQFEARSSVRTWLFKIATNTALDISKKRRRREIPLGYVQRDRPSEGPGDAAPRVQWVEPYPDSPEASYESRETLELAYVAVLQELSAQQRAAFILREVLHFPAIDAAAILDSSVAAINSALQRARSKIADRIPKISQQFELDALGDAATRALAERYARAIEESDVSGLLALLGEDPTWSMPPHPGWFSGRTAIASFLRDDVMVARWRHLPLRVSGQLAIAGYLFDDDRGSYVACALDVLALERGRVGAILAFLTDRGVPPGSDGVRCPGVIDFARYGLPEELPA